MSRQWFTLVLEANCIRQPYALIHNELNSRSASDKYTGIVEKTGSQNASAFQRLINGTLFSGEFSKSLTSEQEAVGAYFASGCIDQ